MARAATSKNWNKQTLSDTLLKILTTTRRRMVPVHHRRGLCAWREGRHMSGGSGSAHLGLGAQVGGRVHGAGLSGGTRLVQGRREIWNLKKDRDSNRVLKNVNIDIFPRRPLGINCWSFWKEFLMDESVVIEVSDVDSRIFACHALCHFMLCFWNDLGSEPPSFIAPTMFSRNLSLHLIREIFISLRICLIFGILRMKKITYFLLVVNIYTINLQLQVSPALKMEKFVFLRIPSREYWYYRIIRYNKIQICWRVLASRPYKYFSDCQRKKRDVLFSLLLCAFSQKLKLRSLGKGFNLLP